MVIGRDYRVMYKCLDLFCGLGGWSEGFALEGFEVLGIEIEPKIAKLYPYDVIVQDVKTLNGELFKDYDVIVGSPPCRDFSITTYFGWKKWKDPPNPLRGLELVAHFLRIVKEAKPKIWLMENVPRLEKFMLEPKPKVRNAKLSGTMKRSFWGDFPLFLIPQAKKELINKTKGSYRKWLRAKIPLPISRSFAKVCKNKLDNLNYEDRGD